MTEIVAKIKEAEAQAAEVRRQAQQAAKESEAAAHRRGRELLAKAKEAAAKEAAETLSRAQEEADALVARRGAEAGQRSQALEQDASGRINQAAALIVERIVGTK